MANPNNIALIPQSAPNKIENIIVPAGKTLMAPITSGTKILAQTNGITNKPKIEKINQYDSHTGVNFFIPRPNVPWKNPASIISSIESVKLFIKNSLLVSINNLGSYFDQVLQIIKVIKI